MSTFDCLYSFNLCLMGLGCPLLTGPSDRRLRRCAATDIYYETIKTTAFDSFRSDRAPNNKHGWQFLCFENVQCAMPELISCNCSSNLTLF